MKQYILITGASSEIGLEMARQLAQLKFNLIVVARSEASLKAIAAELNSKYEVEVICITKDLAEINAAREVYAAIKSRNLNVSHVANNAGVGLYGEFISTDLDQELSMIQLNISTVVSLTKLFAADMAKAGEGRIMNVASLLSFLPFPYYSVYSATKAFVLAFTETIAAELEGTGVVVTALCPGPTDTAFNTSEMWSTNAYKTNKPVEPKSVAAVGVELLLHGKGKKIVGFNNWFISNLPRITPDLMMMKIKKNLASRSN